MLSLAARRTEDKVSNEPRKITPCVDNAGGFFWGLQEKFTAINTRYKEF